MQVEFQLTREHYKKFLKSFYFKKDLGKKLFLLAIFSLLIGYTRQNGQAFEFSNFILKTFIGALAVFSIGALIPFLITRIRLQKTIKTKPLSEQRLIAIQEDGIRITSVNEDLFWKWESLKSADMVNEFLYVRLFTNKFYLVPLHFFSSNNEAINFLGVIKNGIFKVRGQSKERKVHNLCYWGLIGFIPNFGAVAGIILTVQGFNYKNRKLILIGIGCILFTVLFWTIIFPLIISK